VPKNYADDYKGHHSSFGNYQSINQSKHICIVPCVTNESEAHDKYFLCRFCDVIKKCALTLAILKLVVY